MTSIPFDSIDIAGYEERTRVLKMIHIVVSIPDMWRGFTGANEERIFIRVYPGLGKYVQNPGFLKEYTYIKYPGLVKYGNPGFLKKLLLYKNIRDTENR